MNAIWAVLIGDETVPITGQLCTFPHWKHKLKSLLVWNMSFRPLRLISIPPLEVLNSQELKSMEVYYVKSDGALSRENVGKSIRKKGLKQFSIFQLIFLVVTLSAELLLRIYCCRTVNEFVVQYLWNAGIKLIFYSLLAWKLLEIPSLPSILRLTGWRMKIFRRKEFKSLMSTR